MMDYVRFSQQNESNDESVLIAIVASIAVIIYVTEAFCYIIFFITLFKHNNGLSILPAEVKKSRNHSNAHTMMGQFYLFITETIYMVLLFLIFALGINKVSSNAKDIGAVYKELEFGLVSVVQCLMIPELRNVIVKYIKGQSHFVTVSFWMLQHLFNKKFLKFLISLLTFSIIWQGLNDGS